ncbi:hypothetical protein TNCV_2090541 [Trichonephila clavipes]|nr:hypothetical protein TNCV_2090541 [Trichonephila clavipes]
MPDRTAGRCASQTRIAVVISTETESGFITEDDTSPVCAPSCPRSAKSVDTAYDVGSVVSVLADVGSSANFGQSSPYGFS